MAPLYSFVDQFGVEIEVEFGMDEVPDIGATTNHDGQLLTRTPSLQSGIVREYRSVNHGLPHVDPKSPYWPHYNDKNQPVVTSRKQAKELEAITGWRFS